MGHLLGSHGAVKTRLLDMESLAKRCFHVQGSRSTARLGKDKARDVQDRKVDIALDILSLPGMLSIPIIRLQKRFILVR